jgi:eukaryotic-like serine/threonine-protein kinase
VTTGRWPRVAEAFEAARQLPAGEREAWLARACPEEVVRAEVLALLRTYDEAPDFLEQPVPLAVAAEALLVAERSGVAGRRVGAWRLTRELGRGGMGVVHEAARADEEFARRVAIKLLPAAWTGTARTERFRFERRVLAGLDHPGIARLYDAGTTEDGVPYFVMELVDGEPIDAWCANAGLSLRERVELMLRVSAAVGHAHQNLVVHRDLKPGNIFVTRDGQPKLLDFGIAKLLSEEAQDRAGLTGTGQQAFTAEYASPEQVRGEAVTTAGDVYSLGVLLYLLLAGQPPYDLKGLSPLEAMRRVLEAEPPAPSRVAPAARRSALRGDLESVLLKALRKDPQERYVSVFAFADDLRAWLDGRPVSATRPTWAYRTGKAVRRHKAVAAAAVAVALAVGAGGASTAWEAHVARIERDKAENRFREVRQFSRSLLFEIHESLRTLPGATEPRRQLLGRTVQFLDGLARDAGEDAALKIELAEGYRQLGQVEGSAVSENVGDIGAAIRSFEKAARLGEEALATDPRSVPAADVTSGAYGDLGSATLEAGGIEAAERAFRRHLALAERLEREHAGDAQALASVASSYVTLGYFRGQRNDHAGAKPFYEKAIGLYASLPETRRAGPSTARTYAYALKRLGAVLLHENDLAGAERCYQSALGVEEALVGANPGNSTYRYDLTFSLSDLGFVARKRFDLARAEAFYRRALAIRLEALAADPRDVRAARGVAATHSYLAGVYHLQNRHAAAAAETRRSMAVNEDLVAHTTALTDRHGLAWNRVYLAQYLIDQAESLPAGSRRRPLLDEARRRMAQAEAVAREAANDNAAPDPAMLKAWDTQSARAASVR